MLDYVLLFVFQDVFGGGDGGGVRFVTRCGVQCTQRTMVMVFMNCGNTISRNGYQQLWILICDD